MTSVFKVLVVDDSTTLRKLIEIAMRGTGCEVSFAATGAEAINKALDLMPDVILLDYILPDLKSVDVCKQLAASNMSSGIPIVLMSANQRSILDEFRQFASVVDFIGKPFTALEIKARLQGAGRQRAVKEAPVNALGMAARAPAPPSSVPRRPESGVHRPLQLAGSLAVTPLLDIIKLLAAAQATGALLVEQPDGAGVIRVSLRRGEILLATRSHVDWASLGKAITDAVTPQLRAQIVKNQETGRPAAVTLVEVGLTKMSNQPLELQSTSGQVLSELMSATSGDFTWQNLPVLPDYVEAFGRHISIASLALGHLRGNEEVNHSALVDQIFERSGRFSQKLASAKLNPEEQRVLSQVDGNVDARSIAGRSKVSLERACSILARLLTADLIVSTKGSQSPSSRTLAILDNDKENFIAPMQAWLGSRANQVEMVELDGSQSLLAAAKRIRPNLIIVGDSGLMNEFIYKDLPQITSDGSTVVVALLGTANASRARELIQAGFHSVLSKPVHFDDLERVLAL